MTHDFDRLPHYDVGGKKFLSTARALREICTTGNAYRFSLFEKSWGHYDWTHEPSQSWEELLRRRCQQIRDQYEWVSLLYSAGRDSDLILQCFIENKIPLDEVIIRRNVYDISKPPIVDNVVIPIVKQRLKHSPEIKLTVYDLNAQDIQKTFSEDWMDQPGAPGGYWTFHPVAWHSAIENRPDIFSQVDRGLKYTSILGLDKPKLKIEQGHWCMYTQDQGVQSQMHRGNLEWFYLTPDMPELHAKQCWMAIRHAEQHHRDKDIDWINRWSKSGTWGLGPDAFDDFSRAIGRRPSAHPVVGFGTDKKVAGDPLYQHWIDQSMEQGCPYAKRWKQGLDDLNSVAGSFAINSDMTLGSIGILGKSYQLKKYESSHQ
jgi:hypothetical protein